MFGSLKSPVLFLAAMMSAASAGAVETEDPVLASVDARYHPPAAPAQAGRAGQRFTLSAEGETLTFTVPDGCAAWRAGEDGASLTMSCSEVSWPKLSGLVRLALADKPSRFRAEENGGSAVTAEGFRIETRITLLSGPHEGKLQAICLNAWNYCNDLAAEGWLAGERTILRFSATTWDGATARALGRAVAAAAVFGDGKPAAASE